MSYKKSIARKEFEETVGVFIQQSKFADIKRNNIPHDVCQCVYRNAIFQTSAAIEEYLSSLLEDWIHLLHLHAKTLSDVPKELIFWSAEKKQTDAFKNYLINGDEDKFINALCSIKGLEAHFNGGNHAKEVIFLKANISDRKYPSIKNINALFKRFGISNIFREIHIKWKADYKNLLESFSDIRTEIAHQHPAPDITFKDVRNNLINMTDLISKIDRLTYSHIVRTSGSECWKISRL